MGTPKKFNPFSNKFDYYDKPVTKIAVVTTWADLRETVADIQAKNLAGTILLRNDLTLTADTVLDLTGIILNLNGLNIFQGYNIGSDHTHGYKLSIKGTGWTITNGAFWYNNLNYNQINVDNNLGMEILGNANDIASFSSITTKGTFESVSFVNYVGTNLTTPHLPNIKTTAGYSTGGAKIGWGVLNFIDCIFQSFTGNEYPDPNPKIDNCPFVIDLLDTVGTTIFFSKYRGFHQQSGDYGKAIFLNTNNASDGVNWLNDGTINLLNTNIVMDYDIKPTAGTIGVSTATTIDFITKRKLTADKVGKFALIANPTTLELEQISLENLIPNTSDYLGNVNYNSLAPIPNKSGYYFFATAGVCSWLSGTPTVKIGDKVTVVYTAPNTYVYGYVPIVNSVNSDNNYKTCDILPAGANIQLAVNNGTWQLTLPTACRIALKDAYRIQPASTITVDLTNNVINYLWFKSTDSTITKDVSGSYVPSNSEYLFAIINVAFINQGAVWISSPIYEISGKKYGYGAQKIGIEDLTSNYKDGGSIPLSAEGAKLQYNALYATTPLTSSSLLSQLYYDKKQANISLCPVGSANIDCMVVTVTEGQTWHLLTTPRNDGRAYLFYMADGSLDSYHDATFGNVELDIVIPAGITKMGINCDRTSQANLDRFSLRLTSDISHIVAKAINHETRIVAIENDTVSLNSLKGKKVYVLGSSAIMLMGNVVANNVRDWTELKTLTGATSLHNLALGGSTWQRKVTDSDTPVGDDGVTNFVSNQVKWLKRLVDTLGYPTPDVILIQATNDYNSGGIDDNLAAVMAYSFADLEANTNDIRSTFFGGARYALELMNRYFPTATYFISDGYQASAGAPYYRGYDYINSGYTALKKICDRYSVPFLATSKELGVVDSYENGATNSIYLGDDGLHPNNKGKTLIARYFAKSLGTRYFKKQ